MTVLPTLSIILKLHVSVMFFFFLQGFLNYKDIPPKAGNGLQYAQNRSFVGSLVIYSFNY